MSFKPRNGQSMKALILSHLRQHGTISPIEASAMWACRDLPKRISELKKDGHPITTELKHDSMGQRYARYTLHRPVNAETAAALPWVVRQHQQFEGMAD